MADSNPTYDTQLSIRKVVTLLGEHRRLWIAPAVAGFVLAAVYSLLSARQWEASQGLIVRSEAAGYAQQRLGKFTDLSEMKTAQETVLELARSSAVLQTALEKVGRRPSWFSFGDFPTRDHVEDLRDQVTITPPGGAEFGKTEVFYLSVKDTDRDRAIRLATAIATELETELKQLRRTQAMSMASELVGAAEQATDKLKADTAELAVFEAAVGVDLAELRNLVSPIGGQGELAQKALAVEAEIRQSELARRQGAELLAVLSGAASDPMRLLATPGALLVSQPALERLKTGLINAQLRTAELEGSRSSMHPLVIAARETEKQMHGRLHRELPTALKGVELELKLAEQREAALRAELASVHKRASSLAGKRAEYARLVAAVENQTRVVDQASQQLADARAHAAGAATSSVLDRVGVAEAGNYPVGPGRTAVSLAGGLTGLTLGLGLVFLLHGPKPTAVEADFTSATTEPAPADRSVPQEPFGYADVKPFGVGQVANDYALTRTTPAVTTTGSGYYGSTVCAG